VDSLLQIMLSMPVMIDVIYLFKLIRFMHPAILI